MVEQFIKEKRKWGNKKAKGLLILRIMDTFKE
jgi:hypothetical protein